MVDRPQSFLRRDVLALSAFSALDVALLGGCNNNSKESEAVASEAVDLALGFVERDVPQLRAGLPDSVKVLLKRLPTDPVGSREELQTAIKAARENTNDLAFSKITFLSYATAEGVVLRSEAGSDNLADQNIVKVFPALAKAHEQPGSLAEAYGEMDALRGVHNGADTAWVVATSVPSDDPKKPRGLFIAGWSFRLYARSLQDGSRNKYGEKIKGKVLPLIYIYILKGTGAYGDPDAPDVNADELVKLKALDGALKGEFRTNREIEKRTFGIVAKKAPLLGEDAAIAAVASVF
ncbi:MAG: hypothetical protein U0271_03945 [Polyangiaceae bacterium]